MRSFFPISSLFILLFMVEPVKVSGDVAGPACSLDGGGGRGSIPGYTFDACITGFEGSVGVFSNGSFRIGFCGQLYDIEALRVEAEESTTVVSEGASVYLETSLIFDDGTQEKLAQDACVWSVASGVAVSVDHGMLSIPAVYAQTSTVIRATYSGAVGSYTLTILNTGCDDYGRYWFDGLPDDWQIQYFGVDAAHAGADADYDGDGLSNHVEYQRGLNPARIDTDGDGIPDAVDTTPVGESHVIRRAGDYTIVADTLDAGGGAAYSSFAYAQLTSLNALQGAVQTSTDISTNCCGFVGQLEEPLFSETDIGLVLDSPALVPVDLIFTNLITVVNNGPDVARDVTVSISWSSALSDVSASTATGTWSWRGLSAFEWQVGSLSNGMQATFRLACRALSTGLFTIEASGGNATAVESVISNNSATVSVRSEPLNRISANTFVSASDHVTIDDKMVRVEPGVTLTVAGKHRVLTLDVHGTVTHLQGDTNGVNLDVEQRFELTQGASIDVTDKGYRGGYRDGNPYGDGETRGMNGLPTRIGGAQGKSGGSYASFGQNDSGFANGLYGSEIAPVDLGSGGATDQVRMPLPGNGGGRVDIAATEMVIDGAIKANGGNGEWCVGGGSGGSVWLRLKGGTLSGRGSIEVRGGTIRSDCYAGAGGDGRLAITGFGANYFTGTVSRAGTIFVQPSGMGGLLTLCDTVMHIEPGQTNRYASILCAPSSASVITNAGTLAFTEDTWTIPSGLRLVQDGAIIGAGRIDGMIGSLNVASNAVVTHSRGEWRGLQLRIAGRLVVENGGLMDASAQGYRGAFRDGNLSAAGETQGTNGLATISQGATGNSGGSYGGFGSDIAGHANGCYGTITAPVELGSGGATDQMREPPAGNGGGRIEVEALDMVIDGCVRSDGGAGAWCAGAGSGGAVWLRLRGGTFSGRGLIEARGGTVREGDYAAAGGGGRIAVTGFLTNSFCGNFGRAGTRFVQQQGHGGELTLDSTSLTIAKGTTNTYSAIQCAIYGASTLTNAGTLAFTTDTWTVPAGLTVTQDGVIIGADRADGMIGSLCVASNAVMTHSLGSLRGLQLRIAEAFTVQAGGLLDASAKGYRGAFRDGNLAAAGETRGEDGAATTTNGATGNSGGSYGGFGDDVAGHANGCYGTITAPVELGSGGATDQMREPPAGNGGGRIEVEALDMVIDGCVRSDGGEGAWCAGGGSGGSIGLRLRGSLTIHGVLSACGGRSRPDNYSGSGGGGRIAVTGFVTTNISGAVSAGNGTIYWSGVMPLDSDLDGLSDIDEVARGTNPNLRDTDGDGMSDGDEIIATTDPLSSKSALAFIAIQPQVEGVHLWWQGGMLATQVLQRMSDASLSPAVPIYTNYPPMALTNDYVDVLYTNTLRLYRIQILH